MANEGITGTPYKTPQVRRKIPTAYARPSITLGGSSGPAFVKRSWKDIPVTDVAEHDTVAEFGIVVAVLEVAHVVLDGLSDYVWQVRLHNVMGDWKDYPGDTRVFAFTADPGD